MQKATWICPKQLFFLEGLVWGKGSRGDVGYIDLTEIPFCR